MTRQFTQLGRWWAAFTWSIILFRRVWSVRRRLDSRIGVASRTTHFPQLEWQHYCSSVRSIFEVSRVPDRIDEIERERQKCFRLWQHVSCLPKRDIILSTSAGQKLRDAALEKIIEQALGKHRRSFQCLKTNAATETASLQTMVLRWLVAAGADRKGATLRSLANSVGFVGTAPAESDSIMLTDQQRAKLAESRARLDEELRQRNERLRRDAIWQEYQAHDLALVSLPESYERALAYADKTCFGKL